AADPIVPVRLLRTRPVAVASAALFFTLAALFAITVFVPLFLQVTTGATPTQAGLLLAPAMLAITVSTTVSGRLIARTGRYKRFPIIGLGLMTAALVLMAVLASHPSRLATGAALAAHGAGPPPRGERELGGQHRGEVRVDELHGHRALADGGGASLCGARAHVARRQHAGHACLEQTVAARGGAREHEAVLIAP